MPAVISFRQVFFDDRAGEGIEAAKAVLAELQDGSVATKSAHRRPDDAPVRHDARAGAAGRQRFGVEFADALVDVPPGDWLGPLRSAFGVHLVHVDERQDARDPPLSDVLDAVTLSWETAKRREIAEQPLRRAAERYEVVIETPAEAR